jgi:hypothetical protein
MRRSPAASGRNMRSFGLHVCSRPHDAAQSLLTAHGEIQGVYDLTEAARNLQPHCNMPLN